MTNKRVAFRRIGSNAPIVVQIYDGDGGGVVDLTGMTGLSAVCTHTSLNETVVLTANLLEAVNGKIKLTWTVGAFTEEGEYTVKITGTDDFGNVQIYPRQVTNLLLQVGA